MSPNADQSIGRKSRETHVETVIRSQRKVLSWQADSFDMFFVGGAAKERVPL